MLANASASSRAETLRHAREMTTENRKHFINLSFILRFSIGSSTCAAALQRSSPPVGLMLRAASVVLFSSGTHRAVEVVGLDHILLYQSHADVKNSLITTSATPPLSAAAFLPHMNARRHSCCRLFRRRPCRAREEVSALPPLRGCCCCCCCVR